MCFFFFVLSILLKVITIRLHTTAGARPPPSFTMSTTSQKAPRSQNECERLPPLYYYYDAHNRCNTQKQRKERNKRSSRCVEMRLEPVVCFFSILFYSLLIIFFMLLTAASSLPPFTPIATSTHRTTHGLQKPMKRARTMVWHRSGRKFLFIYFFVFLCNY